ncbi:DUF3140 domain-containing protein [Histidinibacterium aquaticum]|uniref:DUF3140 domain-containing protein n=1 Tax=Histidinibacterium aquaticum TaxID=2613962 RepID=A0A5J5GKT3_9RHOB|nr:DUF3140 domain-containing protein [Histidinibacterium aquaticum]KAA9008936.1 DUF3140 domain-containing protein [Histidinibacterium aquaticum]
MSKSRDEIWQEWRDRVNMSPKEIEDFLQTEESRSVGDTGDANSTGRDSGKRIVEIKRTDKDDLSDGQWDHMAKVVGYINRHCAQVPNDPEQSDWRWSLMNWGHDPMKDDGCA